MIPPRCFTCNKFIADKYDDFVQKKDGRQLYKDVLDDLGLSRICCRKMLLTHVDVIEDTAMYSSICSVMDDSRTVFNAYIKKERTISCD